MPFIGKNPTAGFASIVKDDFTGNGSTTVFTLSKQVATANDIAVFVGNVRQEPTDAYTVSGTTLTMSAAPATGINFYVLHIAGTIESSVVPPDGSIGTAKLVNDVVTTAKIAAGAVDTTELASGAVTSAKLDTNIDIAGTLDVTGTLTADSAGSVAGTFGIGTTSPGQTLEVNTGNDTNGIRIRRFSGSYYSDIVHTSSPEGLKFMVGNGSSVTERLRILGSGGITFNGDTAAANALDDYEEGTFNVSGYTFAGGGTATITNQDNVYIKVGGLVVVSINITLNFSAGCSGNVTISGLPFSSTNHVYEATMTYNNQSVSWVYDGNVFKGSGNTDIFWYGRSLNISSINSFTQWFTTTYRTSQ